MGEEFSYENFGQRVRRKRQIVGKSGAEVARHIVMPQPQYSQLEHGNIQRMQLAQLVKLAQILECTTDYLLGLSEDRGTIPPDICPEETLAVVGITSPPTTTLLEEGN